MSIKQKTALELKGLAEHGLSVDLPSQCADSFVLGMRWMSHALRHDLDVADIVEDYILANSHPEVGSQPNSPDLLRVAMSLTELRNAAKQITEVITNNAPDRLYHLVTTRSEPPTQITKYPMTHKECMTMKSKCMPQSIPYITVKEAK